jgi:hypothetical protein
MRKFILSLLITSIFTNAHGVKSITTKNIHNLSEFVTEIIPLLSDAELKTAFIFDCDGVLTNHGVPEFGVPIEPRGNIIEVLNVLNNIENTELFVSSAWPIFYKTIARLKNLGLGEICNLSKASVFDIFEFQGKTYRTYTNGHVISTQLCSEEYFRSKAFAPHLVDSLVQYDIVIFIDDSEENVRRFNDEIKLMPYAENANVYTFCIETPDNVANENDIVSEELLMALQQTGTS